MALEVLTPCYHQTHLFFSDVLREQDEAKAICAQCPFRPTCLQKAIDCGAEGIWGGFDDTERRFWVRLYGDVVGQRVQELPRAIVHRLRANRVMKTGPDVLEAAEA